MSPAALTAVRDWNTAARVEIRRARGGRSADIRHVEPGWVILVAEDAPGNPGSSTREELAVDCGLGTAFVVARPVLCLLRALEHSAGRLPAGETGRDAAAVAALTRVTLDGLRAVENAVTVGGPAAGAQVLRELLP